jgi:hypothetical protein
LHHPPEIPALFQIASLEEEGRYEEAKKLRKKYFGKTFSERLGDFAKYYILHPVRDTYRSLFK